MNLDDTGIQGDQDNNLQDLKNIFTNNDFNILDDRTGHTCK